MISLFKQL